MKKNTAKVLKYIRKYIPAVVFSMIMAVLIVASNLYIPILLGRGVDCILGPRDVDMQGVFGIIKTGIAVILGGALAQWLMNVCNNKVTYGVVRDIRRDVFERLEKMPLSYLDAHPTGDIVSRVIADVDQFADGLLMGFSQFLTGVLTILGTLVFMLVLNPLCALVVIVLTPVSFLVARFIATRTFKMFLAQSETRGEQTAYLEETLKGIKAVKACSMEYDTGLRFDEINERLGECSLKATFYSSLTNPSTRFVNSLVYASVAVTGAMLAIRGGITVGFLTSFLSYASQYMKPFNEISGVVTELQNSLTCAGRVFDLLEEEIETESPEEDVLAMAAAEGRVDISHVDFSYVPGRDLIQDLSLSVKSGERIAIVGPTGCGKTTLINLLMRFYDVNEGSISVDGTDIRKMTRHRLRKSYGMVLQDTWIRHATVYENIRMGRKDISDDDIVRAAKSCHAHGFIMRMPKGYDTVISEEGAGLSAGQKQLLCIARVMVKLPPMLILDEATSSIDTRTEMRVQNAFEKMMKGRTSFIVAHRLSTIKNADVILVMKDGNIIEQGSHDELLEKEGFYKKLYMSQFAMV
ncbi:MAG: ABC transporter ATP-binding protein [Lachnospiraceae bacterium]|nr:ABC transporter ATP-binding protein [Lachnospiraceae bacterium]